MRQMQTCLSKAKHLAQTFETLKGESLALRSLIELKTKLVEGEDLHQKLPNNFADKNRRTLLKSTIRANHFVNILQKDSNEGKSKTKLLLFLFNDMILLTKEEKR